MRIWVMSDLHLEFASLAAPLHIPQADICVVAGDVLTGGVVASLRWLADTIVPHMPVLFVAGNHEFYDSVFDDGIAAGKGFAAKTKNLHFLDGDSVDLAGIRCFGASLWTDFALYDWQAEAMTEAARQMSDYRRIRRSSSTGPLFSPQDAIEKHQRDRAGLERALSCENPPTLIMTHHAPSERSLPIRRRRTLLAGAYASDLTTMITAGSTLLWVHGHIHHRSDYMIGNTRIFANPRGYPGEETFINFNPALVLDI